MSSLPYVVAPGGISKALDGIKSAAVPERVSQDFVKTILKIGGGSGDRMTAFLKKIGFSDGSGKPTDLYTRFRNPTSSGAAVAKAIRLAYSPLYVRNEFMHKLSDADLLGLIIEQTGQPHDSNSVKLTHATIKALKKYADFENEVSSNDIQRIPIDKEPKTDTPRYNGSNGDIQRIGLSLGYTINLNLPATSDPAVFNAIFKSLKEHLLRDSDG